MGKGVSLRLLGKYVPRNGYLLSGKQSAVICLPDQSLALRIEIGQFAYLKLGLASSFI